MAIRRDGPPSAGLPRICRGVLPRRHLWPCGAGCRNVVSETRAIEDRFDVDSRCPGRDTDQNAPEAARAGTIGGDIPAGAIDPGDGSRGSTGAPHGKATSSSSLRVMLHFHHSVDRSDAPEKAKARR